MTSLFKALLTLFSHYRQHIASIHAPANMMQELSKTQIAIDKLDQLFTQNVNRPTGNRYLKHTSQQYMPNTIRVYSPDEYERLSPECLGFLHELEKTGILSAKERDLILLHLTVEPNEPFIELDHLKRILLSFFKDKLTSVEHWWLQAWPFKELEHSKGH